MCNVNVCFKEYKQYQYSVVCLLNHMCICVFCLYFVCPCSCEVKIPITISIYNFCNYSQMLMSNEIVKLPNFCIQLITGESLCCINKYLFQYIFICIVLTHKLGCYKCILTVNVTCKPNWAGSRTLYSIVEQCSCHENKDLSIYLSIYPSIHLSIFLSIHPYMHPSIHPSVYLSIYQLIQAIVSLT